uniref:Protein FAR1-RELATED SEQUENCE n=1 Tax=Lactuca sativa TaxID=4236 RepID=A0A9R1WW64_LACSA|nr:hypothetical protein LSAT_V11C800427180 [Lactuca sativa]
MNLRRSGSRLSMHSIWKINDGSMICSNYMKMDTCLLLHLMMNYNITIQKQRNTQKELDHETKKGKNMLQKFIQVHCFMKYINKSTKVPGTAITNLLEQKMDGTNDVKCTSKHFNHFRTLCRHAFNIIMKHGIKEITEQYIENHWRKDVISRYYHFGRHETVKLTDLSIKHTTTLKHVRKNKDKIDLFVKKTKSMLKEYENNLTNELQKNRTNVEVVGKLMCISIPKDIDINVPNVKSNKESGKKNRIQSETEIANKYSNKQTRTCSRCGERAPHNLCTCPIKLAAEQSSKAT